MKFPQQFRTRLFFGFILVLGIGWIWLSSVPANAIQANMIPAPQTGFLAPDFTLKTLAGKFVTLSDLRGKVVLVNIWASWCPPCRAEMPAIERVYQAYQTKGFEVLAVNSTVQDTISGAQSFVSEIKPTFPILLDETGLVTRLYRIQSLPTSFFVGSDGVIHEIVIGGPMAEAQLINRVEKLLQDKR
jgi:thiol-disulfide isomerase/thioredoxin